ncbi:serine O-acetyltransferase [Anaerofustis stercorihominis]|uniref:Serine O-acetyltransferase n=2 Tax=Anaerofustis stercorihominis TaxID=214853 RepID=B1C676_9FIRM|nr:serine acetyltransferase [Anaerofustis stercorihominis]EDS73361.1 putative serine O-acetyltransferase [Anaerofustis stercorihominis DSM 17244]MCQ4794813.1 serine acetyltransferase [Anaerofustis stercorihominis]RGD75525.1 serine acetyltransferase [Anaerofustis stercorihominis]
MGNMKNWLETRSKEISSQVVDINKKELTDEGISGFGTKLRVTDIIKNLEAGLFPTIYEKDLDNKEFINIYVRKRLNMAAMELNGIIREVFINMCDKSKKDENCDKCTKKADEATIKFMESIPKVREILSTDIVAAYNGDPAAMSIEEILLSYPYLEAITIQRLAHELFLLEVPLIPRIMTEYAHARTGIDIHPGAKIGKYFFIDHATGVVIGETCVIGDNVKLYQGVTLGAKSFELDDDGNPVKGVKRHPNIEDNVIIYSGATILGGTTTVGEGSIIGGSVWLTTSVPKNSRVYNNTPDNLIEVAK